MLYEKYRPKSFFERLEGKIYKQLDKILNFSAQKIPVFIDGDLRGYALKIEDYYIRKYNLALTRDMGGYGLICPEIN
jgi:hypothetical protein